MKKAVKIAIVFVALAMIPAMAFAQATLNRNETLYASGGLWSAPSNWNPFQYTGVAFSGTVGLLYEPLFFYNPVTGENPPCLALSGKWINTTTYQVKLRENVKWSDGKPFSADDVVFTFMVAKGTPISWGSLFDPAAGGLKSVNKVDASTVNFVFEGARYQQFQCQLYQIPIVPKHIYEGVPVDKLMADNNENAIGTGPYLHLKALADRDIYVRNDNWWGKEAFGKLPAPKNIVLLMVNDNATALGMMLQGQIDIFNNYTPGVGSLVQNFGNHLTSFYKKQPYNLSYNTVMLYMNTKKKPMDDPAFRKALAFAIDTQKIADVDYTGGVLPADSSGFLPTSTLMSYIDKPALQKLYFKYDPKQAAALLDKAGYKLKGKYRVNKDGTPITLQINCPTGWSDWEIGIRMIAENLQAVGINAEAKPVDFNLWQSSRFKCTFDMLLDNNTAISSSPMNYLNGVVTQNIDAANNTRGNWGQYKNDKLKDLMNQFDMTNPVTDMAKSKSIMTQIQTILLTDMPAIPLWYNGLWFLGGTDVWTGYSNEENKLGVTCIWGNTWQMGTVQVLLNLKSKS